MKNKFLKCAIFLVLITFVINFTACTYREEGSEIQDVTFTMSYVYDEDTVSIDGTLKLYKTFAPKTTEHILSLIKNGFYENSNVVFSEDGSFIELGAFDYSDGSYIEKEYTGSSIYGEFDKNGWANRLTASAGTLVMIRDYDSNVGDKKYDTAKAKFGILLTTNSEITKDKYCVFGKVDSSTLTKLSTMQSDLETDDDGYTKYHFVGSRNEESDVVEGDSCNYYKLSSKYYKEDKTEMVYSLDTDADYELVEAIKKAYIFDIVVLPTSVITVNNFKIK